MLNIKKLTTVTALLVTLQMGTLALPVMEQTIRAVPPQFISRAEAGSYNCVDEIKQDGYWGKYYNDAFAGAGNASEFGRQAASKGWLVDGSPEVGDVAVFRAGDHGAYAEGHVAIVIRVDGSTVDVRERNPGPPGSVRRGLAVQGGMSFVHHRKRVTTYKTETYQSGTRSERYQSGTRSERYQSGTRSERYQSGTRSERYQSGTRSERYQCGWNDHWVFRNWRFVNERTPKYCSRQVPVFSTRQVPVFDSRQVPVYSTRPVPVYSTRQVPVFSTRQIPVYSTRQVPGGTSIQTMP